MDECWILCCHCGTPIHPNTANMCIPCLQTRVDITEGIEKQVTVQFCRSCERYFQPPSQWLVCRPESRELLSLCLKRIKLGNEIRLVDAGFLWTEPHSFRLKIKLSIQKEIFANAILQQTFPVDIHITNQQCPNCMKIMAKNTWNTSVQVRQKVEHQRTFLMLEQLILKRNAHAECLNIKKVPHGLDFFFASRTHAVKFTEFLETVVPVKVKASEQLLSKDIHSATSSYKFTFSVEILPLCKGDLICLPSSMAKSAGIYNAPLVLVTKVGKSTVSMIDPASLKVTELPANEFWHHNKRIQPLFSYADMRPFVVLDLNILGSDNPAYQLADVEVGQECDSFANSVTIRTHLGRILRPGDYVMGYDLSKSNTNNDDFSRVEDSLPQSVYLVKKFTPTQGGKKMSRTWKLKHLKSIDTGDETENETRSTTSMNIVEHKGKRIKKAKKAPPAYSTKDQDMELFLQEIEEDPEFRSQFNLYKTNVSSRFAVLTEVIEGSDEPNPIDVAELLDDLSIGSSSSDNDNDGDNEINS